MFRWRSCILWIMNSWLCFLELTHIVDTRYGDILLLCLFIRGKLSHKNMQINFKWGSIFRLSHLWTNIIFQLILGILLEMFQGWKRIAIIYFSSILGGSLFITVLRPHIYAVGASAGVYGLLFSHLSTIILNWNETNRKFSRLFWLLLYIIFDVSLSLYLELVPKVHLNVIQSFYDHQTLILK